MRSKVSVLGEYKDSAVTDMDTHLYLRSGNNTDTYRECTFPSITTTLVDVWLESGSIYIAFDRSEEQIELDAKVIIGVRGGRIADIEVLLNKEGVEKLKKLLRP